MLDILKDELDRREVFSENLPEFVLDLAKTISSNRINDKMKITITISELMLFASQFRRNILHFNKSLIPINAITFCISPSGMGKDSSINMMRKNYTLAYTKIYEYRVNKAIQRAIKLAREAKQVNAEQQEVYMKFYTPPIPLFVAPSTNEGFIQYLNELDEDGIGAGYMYSGEIGSELITSSVIIPNIQLISELYDEGKKEVKVLKDKDRQSKEIKNLPVNALFMGSPDNLLFDNDIKKKFKVEFTTKLARRSFFNFNNSIPEQKVYDNVNEILEDEIALDNLANQIREEYDKLFEEVAKIQISKTGRPIPISNECRELLTLYKRYNIELSQTIKRQYPISKLTRAHLHWKALKLSGAFALLKDRDRIEEEDYRQAIVFTELLDEDMREFEIELVKEPYELFVSLVNSLLQDNKCFVNTHTLKKLGYIVGSSNIVNKLKELALLASLYDESGVYSSSEKGIEYAKIVKTNSLGISYLECKGSKAERSKKCSKGFNFEEVDFSALADMLKGDYAYCAFNFKNGIRNKANIIGGCKWVALDIDSSMFSDEETHYLLGNFNHHIVRTSDENNAYKFRVILELDSYVELDDIAYKSFIHSISEYLSLDSDVLPKSQIFYSYSNRKVYSVINKQPIEVRDHLLVAMNTQPRQVISELNTVQKKALLDDPLGTFNYAFNAKDGEGSLMLIRAAKHARDLGMSNDEIISLVEEINDYWEYPMDRTRLDTTILSQVRRW